MAPTYSVPPHVLFCEAGRFVVFLDLRKNKYSSIRVDDLGSVARSVSNLRIAKASNKKATDESLLRAMSDQGLLQGCAPDAMEAATRLGPENYEPATSVLERSQANAPRIRVHHVLSFFLTVGRAHFELRFRTIERIVYRVHGRKMRKRRRFSAMHLERARILLSMFQRISLLISLALIEFFSVYGVYPDWVFGVRTEPFSAHCWVQVRNVLLDEDLEKVRLYSPIMRV